ncbi:VanW family protein [Phycicoccus sp.]|uniref:VanW family protein n=1 Tax=Phycicoccus sp. TaxID=1902410 RepID=UPI002B6A5059|nr:VanW family protein [Phycicoccus sp.]HMM94097.1 VanW family protein [Phycicoccus sp.]
MTQDLLDHSGWEEPSWEEPAPGPRRWPLHLLGLLVLLGALYVGAAAWAADRVPRGTTVAGVDVGGQSAARARAILTRALGDPAALPLTLTSPVGKSVLDPVRAGLSVDVPASVAGLTGFSLAPARVWQHVTGGSDRPAVVRVDDAAFAASVEAARPRIDGPPKEGSVSIAGGKAVLTPPTEGMTTDLAATTAAVRRWWPAQDSVRVAGATKAPKTSARELQRVHDEFATVAVSGPITVEAGGRSVRIAPRVFAPAVVLTAADDGTVTPRADPAKLRALVHAVATKAGMEVPAKDAVVTFTGGDWRKPHVTPSVAGRAVDDAAIDTAVWKAIAGTERTATVPLTPVEAEFSTAVAQRTLPKERISSFTTYYQAGQPRVHNIQTAARVINGTYVKPGEQFSLNGVLGDQTPEKGYVKAGVLVGNRLSESYGGGISQVSTTIFNASFFAGVQLDAWQAHSIYISRYPEGREATIAWPNLHNKWTNTTDGGILVQVTATDTSITVSYWGTKKYDVTATKSARYAVVQPKKVVDDSPDCMPQNPVPGFKVDIGRIFKQNGKVVRTASFTTTYQPEDAVTCTAAKTG